MKITLFIRVFHRFSCGRLIISCPPDLLSLVIAGGRPSWILPYGLDPLAPDSPAAAAAAAAAAAFNARSGRGAAADWLKALSTVRLYCSAARLALTMLVWHAGAAPYSNPLFSARRASVRASDNPPLLLLPVT